MAFTGNSDIFLAVHETGIGRVLQHMFEQRTSLFNYTTSGLTRQTERLCVPIRPHPVAVARGDRLVGQLPPLPVAGTGYAVEYSVQLTTLAVDATPVNTIAVPPELSAPAAPQHLVLQAGACLGYGCPPADIVKQLPVLPASGDRLKDATTIPAGDLLCSCVDVFASLAFDFEGADTQQHLKGTLDGLEIVDLGPTGLENSIECYLGLVIRLGLLPQLEAPVIWVTQQLGDLFVLTVEPTQASVAVPNNPAIEEDEFRIFLEVATGPAGPTGGSGAPGASGPDPNPGAPRPRVRTGPFDATAAASEGAAQELFSAVRNHFTLSGSGGNDFGAFGLTYAAAAHLENGSITLNDDGSIKLDELDLVFDTLRACISFDIPEICVGGFCIIPNPFGGCIIRAPRICLFGDDPDIEFCLDIATLVRVELSATMQAVSKYSINPGRTAGMNDWDAADANVPNHWQVYIDPGTIDLDLFDIADIVGELLEDAVDAAIDTLLGPLPGWAKDLVRALLGPIIDLVRGILDFGDDLSEWLSDKLGVSLGLFNFLLTAVADYFANKSPIVNLEEPIKALPGVAGLMPVLIPIEFVGVQVTGDELVVGVDVGGP